ncbi:hypothetical protein Cni_G08321 [Canna indica]|uniref:Uncharacterized protein n=1 Tax=Canna indica TaxID=4628 RepID=A0AAQ3Q8J0_9LILI|nr:hypothetical protein Cni_G08321 [Canna indica]
MGACTSCEAAAVVGAAATVKVVLPDGELQEYSRPVTAACALEKDSRRFFLCDADEMEFDRLVTAVAADEELRPGQLYFVLPRSMLKHPLHADDLAALAVKASAALVGRCGSGAVAPLVFPAAEVECGDRKGVEKGRRLRKGSGKGRKFSPDLSAIPE